MNFSDPDLVLVKGKAEGKISYFQVAKQQGSEFTLIDLVRGGRYHFKHSKLIDLVEKVILKISSKSEFSHIEKLHIIKNPEIKKRVKPDRKCKEESVIKRKMAYIDHINKLELRGLTEKRLKPEIEKVSKRINDANPPAWRTVIRWIKNYIESGWDKKALYNHHLQGSRKSRIDPVALTAIKEVSKVWRGSPSMKLIDAYGQIVEKLQDANIERQTSGLPLLKIPSYNTIRTRIRSIE